MPAQPNVNPRDLAALASGAKLSKLQWSGIVVAVIFGLLLPLLVSDYRTFQYTLVLVYAMAVLGLNILTGFNGQFSLGHSAFYAIGAYTAAIMMDQWEIAYYWPRCQ